MRGARGRPRGPRAPTSGNRFDRTPRPGIQKAPDIEGPLDPAQGPIARPEERPAAPSPGRPAAAGPARLGEGRRGEGRGRIIPWMRLSGPLLLVLAVVTGLYLAFGRGAEELSGLEATGRSAPAAAAPQDAPLADAVPRDELGAVIPSDPADDLPGVEPGAASPVVLPERVGEREVHLLELYGQQTVEQLRSERDVLRRRLETELALAFDEAFARGEGHVERSGAAPTPPPRTSSGAPLFAETRTATDPRTLESAARRVTLGVDAHPHLYELRDTLEWLDARIGDRRR